VSPAATAGQGVISSDFETFLVMLTTQMENQDPLNPIESSDFAVQLATFSGVEQQVRTNELLARMSAGASMSDLASWVGLDARVSGDTRFDDAPVRVDTGPDRPGQTRQLVVRNDAGVVVSREALPAGTGVTDWVGLDANGRPLAAGTYDLTVDYLREAEVVASIPVASFSTIVEARRAGTGTELVLADGRILSADEVEAVRTTAR
jgi:flagellar basal-body rod modification protein FlgD